VVAKDLGPFASMANIATTITIKNLAILFVAASIA